MTTGDSPEHAKIGAGWGGGGGTGREVVHNQ